MSTGTVVSLIIAIIVALIGIAAIAKKKICILWTARTTGGTTSRLRCYEGAGAIVIGVLLILGGIALALQGFGVF